jgi:hypothetical protein
VKARKIMNTFPRHSLSNKRLHAEAIFLLQANLDKPFYVWGEDALLSWPGAEPALIKERDAFMARVLAASATGTNSNAPAFVAEQVRPGWGYWGWWALTEWGLRLRLMQHFLTAGCL